MIRRLWYVLSLAIIGLICGLGLVMGMNEIQQAQTQFEQVRQSNLRLDKENRILYRTAQNLRQDPQALEKLCRSELGLIRPDEVIYVRP
jgi:cell division protein FtsB